MLQVGLVDLVVLYPPMAVQLPQAILRPHTVMVKTLMRLAMPRAGVVCIPPTLLMY